jgi:hypothetical protein
MLVCKKWQESYLVHHKVLNYSVQIASAYSKQRDEGMKNEYD